MGLRALHSLAKKSNIYILCFCSRYSHASSERMQENWKHCLRKSIYTIVIIKCRGCLFGVVLHGLHLRFWIYSAKLLTGISVISLAEEFAIKCQFIPPAVIGKQLLKKKLKFFKRRSPRP